tara:strand:+ start:1632 stop:2255 length:624 start_codon:yes stop_codon:yes gene_type:complete
MALSKITAASITDNTITNTQINNSAAIAQSKLGALALANMPSGSVLQIQHAHSNLQMLYNASANAWTNINGLTVNITPTATSNKIFITGYVQYGHGSNPNGGFRLRREETSGGGNSNVIGAVDDGDSDYIRANGFWNSDDYSVGNQYVLPAPIAFSFVDTAPSANQLTYKIQQGSSANSSIQYINHPSQGTAYGRGTHSITVMEIKA